MSDDSKAPSDLSNLGIDLSDIFRPAWTVESTDNAAKLAAKCDEGDRFERLGRSAGGDRGGPRNRGVQGRAPRGGGEGGGRDRDARSRQPQSGGGNRDTKGTGGAQRGSPRGERRDSRGPRQEDRRPEPPPKPMLHGWKLDLIPQTSALEGIAKQIRSRAKAYPIFELARLIINLSDRYSVKLTAESEASPELFRARPDGSLWTSRKAAVSHILAKYLDQFYRRSSIAMEAPKGSHSVVAQCGMSGVLLGPPNHHEYQSRLLALHATRFKNLPFEVYKNRVKMMRDDALMEQWKSEQSTRTVFMPIPPQAAVTVEEVSDTPVAEVLHPSIASESVIPSDVPVDAAQDGGLVAENVEISESHESGDPTEPASDGKTEAVDESAPHETGLSLEEVTAHFSDHHASVEVEFAGNEITVAGKVALHESDPLLHELLIKSLQELDRFPLPLAQVIGKELSSNGLQIYKAQKKIHVSVARPKYLDRGTTPTSEGFRKILDYLEAHPNQHRDKQWAGLLAQITEPEGDTPEAVARREQALGTDLLWLLHQGHVIDFAMGNLQAALKPAPKPTAVANLPREIPTITPVLENDPSPEAIVGEKSDEPSSIE